MQLVPPRVYRIRKPKRKAEVRERGEAHIDLSKIVNSRLPNSPKCLTVLPQTQTNTKLS